MTTERNFDPGDYDCENRTFRDWVRERHDIKDDVHDAMVSAYFNGAPIVYKEIHFDDLNLSPESCGAMLIHIWYDPQKLNSSDDIFVGLTAWPSSGEPEPPSDRYVHSYFSDMYFNASKLHFGMSTIQFRPAYKNGYRTIAMRFKGSLTWHHANLTSQIPFDSTHKYLP